MLTQPIPIILNGVTGRMGTNQHLDRSLCAIIKQGGVRVSDELTLVPELILTGRNEARLRDLAERFGHEARGETFEFTTDLDAAFAKAKADPGGEHAIFFDASGTLHRAGFVERAAAAGLAIYCEKPTAVKAAEAHRLADLVENLKLKNGVVQDKLWLPGFRKIAQLKEEGFFGKILSVRGDFGYWVFTGMNGEPPAQRPSWNYRKEDGGGIMVDMFCHWQYLITKLFGEISSLVAHGNIDISTRSDESGTAYSATADDSAYALFQLKDGTVCQFNSSWCVRVRRDDLLTVEIHGTKGSAVAGLREVYTQTAEQTPCPVWNPDTPQPINFYDSWKKMPNTIDYDNAFKIQWEEFIRHVAADTAFPHTLRDGAKGVELAELGLQSWQEKRWVEVPGASE